MAEASHGNLWELPAGLVERDEEASLDGVRGAAVRELDELRSQTEKKYSGCFFDCISVDSKKAR